MKKIKTKTIVTLLCAILLLSCAAALLGVAAKPKAHAETVQYFTDKQYTDSDYLLLPDGTESTTTIQKFAEDVRYYRQGMRFPALAQVIPRQYLEATETNAVYYYIGKEYGYYVAKRGEFFDVLLFDITTGLNKKETGQNAELETESEYKIRIEPILQQGFERLYNSITNEYTWEAGYSYNHPKYYVANPRFVTVLYNENALNYGDNGYSKDNDEGAIIKQYRANYGKVVSATNTDVNNYMAKVGGQIVLDVGCSIINAVCGAPTGTLVKLGANAIYSIVSEGRNLSTKERDQFVECVEQNDNEKNTFTTKTKDEQASDSSFVGYTRVAGFAPNEDLLLSDAENSYAELITMLDRTNYKSRLIQVCQFDIVRKTSDTSAPEFITGADVDSSWLIFDKSVLFEDKAPTFEIDANQPDGATQPLYILPSGEQEVGFTPKYTGVYNFDLPSNATLVLNGSRVSSCSLQAGQKYTFKVYGNNVQKIISTLRCYVEQYPQDQPYSIPANTNVFAGYFADATEYKKFTVSNGNAKIGLLDDHFNTLVTPTANNLCYYFESGKKYFFVINNSTTSQISSSIVASQLTSVGVGDINIAGQDSIVKFQNSHSGVVNFQILLHNIEYWQVSMHNASNNPIAVSFNDEYTAFLVSLAANQLCYICFDTNVNANASITIKVATNASQWIVNGKAESNNIRLKPNSVNTIRLNVNNNGTQISVNTFLLKLDYTGIPCTVSPGKLNIGNAPNGTTFKVYWEQMPEFKLYVTVDDMITKIRLMHEDGTNNYDEVNAELGQNIPKIAAPTRSQYKFLGYYTAQNGQGSQYIDGNMNGSTWDKDVDNYTLYAHWQRVEITITFDNSANCSDRYYYATATIGQSYPIFRKYAPKRDGYEFGGYYTGQDGTGMKYYSMAVVNDQQSADIYGYDKYMVETITTSNQCNATTDITLFAYWKLLDNSACLYKCVDSDLSQIQTAYAHFKHNTALSYYPKEIEGYTFKYFLYNGVQYNGNPATFAVQLKRDTDGEIRPKYYFAAVYETACVAEGTLITLADGRQVPVESLTGNEMLLVWNLKTGSFDSARILFIDKDQSQIYKVINLGFSDGTIVKVISEHAFWDYNINEYVYLRHDAANYIGHWFSKQITNPDGSISTVRVKLTSVEVRDEYTTAYSPVTYSHLCYYVNGMLSMPGGIGGLFNIFEVDPDTMTIDAEAMARDIATYGLFTYEEFAELLPVPQDVFDAFDAQYFKVAIGKGLITMETLQNLFNHYAEFLV